MPVMGGPLWLRRRASPSSRCGLRSREELRVALVTGASRRRHVWRRVDAGHRSWGLWPCGSRMGELARFFAVGMDCNRLGTSPPGHYTGTTRDFGYMDLGSNRLRSALGPRVVRERSGISIRRSNTGGLFHYLECLPGRTLNRAQSDLFPGGFEAGPGPRSRRARNSLRRGGMFERRPRPLQDVRGD